MQVYNSIDERRKSVQDILKHINEDNVYTIHHDILICSNLDCYDKHVLINVYYGKNNEHSVGKTRHILNKRRVPINVKIEAVIKCKDNQVVKIFATEKMKEQLKILIHKKLDTYIVMYNH